MRGINDYFSVNTRAAGSAVNWSVINGRLWFGRNRSPSASAWWIPAKSGSCDSLNRGVIAVATGTQSRKQQRPEFRAQAAAVLKLVGGIR